MKNFGERLTMNKIVLSLIACFSIVLSACTNQTSFSVSSPQNLQSSLDVSSTNSDASSTIIDKSNNTSDDLIFNNQIINDYCEQRLTNEEVYNMYLFNFEKTIRMRPIEEMDFIKIEAKSNPSVLFIDILAYYIPIYAGNIFYFSFEGEEYNYYRNSPFDIYYNGKFYYLNDAYFMGLITKEDVLYAFNFYKNHYNECEIFKYQDNINPLGRTSNNESVINTNFETIKRDYYDLVIKNDAQYQSSNIKVDDIHLYTIYAEVDNVFCANFSIDRMAKTKYLINPIEKTWDTPLVLDNEIIEPFQSFYPVIWINNKSFHTIDEAVESGIVLETTALQIIKQCKMSSKYVNGYLLGS